MQNLNIMNKLFVLLPFIAMLWSCGGGNASEAGKNPYSTAEPAGDPNSYDPNRGLGKWTAENVTLGATIDPAMVAAAEKIQAVKCSSCHKLTEEKLVDHLGQRSALPVAIHYFGLASIRKRLNDMGFNGVVRRTLSGDHFLTDQGNLVIDVTLPSNIKPEEGAEMLDSVPGIVDHGLFLDEADEVLVEMKDGRIERMVRPTT